MIAPGFESDLILSLSSVLLPDPVLIQDPGGCPQGPAGITLIQIMYAMNTLQSERHEERDEIR